MSGIYIHVPFCRKACHYCDFHFSTNLKRLTEMRNALISEIQIQKNFLTKPIETIYFGGGTPSVFEAEDIQMILKEIQFQFDVADGAEITLEANPDDLSADKLQALKSIGINRLSIGVQTFDTERLKFINRTHDAEQARNAIRNAQLLGFENLTADLIYAIPPAGIEEWKSDLREMVNLGLPHISLYGLTIEDNTVFGKWKKSGKLVETTEESAAEQYRFAIEYLKSEGYEHYEVSNFCKPGFASRHNSAYWSGAQYLGTGPGAHSYNGKLRAYNVSNNAKYMGSIQNGKLPQTIEKLSPTQKLNEQILTSLRTAHGIELKSISEMHNVDLKFDKHHKIEQLIKNGYLTNQNDCLALTIEGFMVADEIALQLFYDE